MEVTTTTSSTTSTSILAATQQDLAGMPPASFARQAWAEENGNMRRGTRRHRRHHEPGGQDKQRKHVETSSLRSDPQLTAMLGISGELPAGQATPAREQVPTGQQSIRQAASLTVTATIVVAEALAQLLRAVLAQVIAAAPRRFARASRAVIFAPDRAAARAGSGARPSSPRASRVQAGEGRQRGRE